MMNIEYRDTKEFELNQLRDLFLSVYWDSGNYPDKLQFALKNSHKVFTAWDGDKLVGLINALADGVMTAYFHYMLVHPEYQEQGIGRHLMNLMLEEYKDYARKVVIAYDEALEFYLKCGFDIGTGKVPMFVTYLTT